MNQESGLQVVAEQLVEKVPEKKQTTLVKYEKNNESQWLTPAADWKTIISNKDYAIKLGVLREIAGKERRSFIFSNDFSKIVREFEVYITPMVEDGEPLRDIMVKIHEKIVKPTMELLDSSGDDDENLRYTYDHIYGIIYYLTGNCHLNWKDYDNDNL